MVKHSNSAPPPPAYPRSGSPVVVVSTNGGDHHRPIIHGNGYHSHSTNPGTSNGVGSQRSSTASRNSLTSNHGSSPQHRPTTVPAACNGTNGSSQRNSPIVGTANGHLNHHHNGHHAEHGDNNVNTLVTIRMKPDPQGRFGFNVKVSYFLFFIIRNNNDFLF